MTSNVHVFVSWKTSSWQLPITCRRCWSQTLRQRGKRLERVMSSKIHTACHQWNLLKVCQVLCVANVSRKFIYFFTKTLLRVHITQSECITELWCFWLGSISSCEDLVFLLHTAAAVDCLLLLLLTHWTRCLYAKNNFFVSCITVKK